MIDLAGGFFYAPPVDLERVGREFEIAGTFLRAAPHGAGHINDTFLTEYEQSGRRVRYVVQRLNRRVFPDPVGMMENIRRVLEHLHGRITTRSSEEGERRTLTLVPARNGGGYCRDEAGEIWRTYRFIEGSRSVDVAESPRQAYEAARAFGAFQKMLIDLPGPPLKETLPGFHDTPRRLEVLQAAVSADTENRASQAKAEIGFVFRRSDLAGRLLRLRAEGTLSERVAHNDTKLNNVLLDAITGESLCVIDLDTVMPGLGPWDFGDLVRSAANPAAEDEQDLKKVHLDVTLFEGIARGWLEALSGVLPSSERAALVKAAMGITLECGARFLTDHLAGDRYFRVHRPGQNLDRCRVQLALLRSMEEREEDLEGIVQGCKT